MDGVWFLGVNFDISILLDVVGSEKKFSVLQEAHSKKTYVLAGVYFGINIPL